MFFSGNASKCTHYTWPCVLGLKEVVNYDEVEDMILDSE